MSRRLLVLVIVLVVLMGGGGLLFRTFQAEIGLALYERTAAARLWRRLRPSNTATLRRVVVDRVRV